MNQSMDGSSSEQRDKFPIIDPYAKRSDDFPSPPQEKDIQLFQNRGSHGENDFESGLTNQAKSNKRK